MSQVSLPQILNEKSTCENKFQHIAPRLITKINGKSNIVPPALAIVSNAVRRESPAQAFYQEFTTDSGISDSSGWLIYKLEGFGSPIMIGMYEVVRSEGRAIEQYQQKETIATHKRSSIEFAHRGRVNHDVNLGIESVMQERLSTPSDTSYTTAYCDSTSAHKLYTGSDIPLADILDWLSSAEHFDSSYRSTADSSLFCTARNPGSSGISSNTADSLERFTTLVSTLIPKPMPLSFFSWSKHLSSSSGSISCCRTRATAESTKPDYEYNIDCNSISCKIAGCAYSADHHQELRGAGSIITVEASASAKIFLETQYDLLCSARLGSRNVRWRDLMQNIEQSAGSDADRLEVRTWFALESLRLRQRRCLARTILAPPSARTIQMIGYNVIKPLGRGSFGEVWLVRSTNGTSNPNESATACNLESTKSSGSTVEVFAMKTISKTKMLGDCQEGHVRAERDCLVSLEKSFWIVSLFSCFEDRHNLYLVMEYMIGGDFLTLLCRHHQLNATHARWYVCEMILALEELHKQGWIHRDVKPENFLISSTGHLKLSDFGLAFNGHWSHDQKYFKNHRADLMQQLELEASGDERDQREEPASCQAYRQQVHQKGWPSCGEHDCNERILDRFDRTDRRYLAGSIVGTSQYMAPEVIRGQAYDARCDWWSIGIILYECLYGSTPFVCSDREQTKARVLSHKISLSFPGRPLSEISWDAIDLMTLLLQEQPNRLSCAKYHFYDRVQHCSWDGEADERTDRARYEVLNMDESFASMSSATDIKNHPFFSHINWDQIHLTYPPFIPDVKHGEDTKYSEFSQNAPRPSHDKALLSGATKATRSTLDGFEKAHACKKCGPFDDCYSLQHNASTAQPTRRARDKVLRDNAMRAKALAIRRHSAFAGFAYWRPSPGVATSLRNQMESQIESSASVT